MSVVSDFNSVLEILFALNALTYLFAIEPKRRGELLLLFNEFRDKTKNLDKRDAKTIQGYLLLAHYGSAHLALTIVSLVFAIITIGLLVYGAVYPEAMLSTRLLLGLVVAMLVVVPIGSVWLILVCKTRFEKYLATMS